MGNNYIGTKRKHTSKQFFQTKLCLAITHGHTDQPEIRKDSFSIQHTEPEVSGNSTNTEQAGSPLSHTEHLHWRSSFHPCLWVLACTSTPPQSKFKIKCIC